MGEITLQQDQVDPLTREITLQQDQVDPLTQETPPAAELKYIRLKKIKHSQIQLHGTRKNQWFTEYIYRGQLSDSIEGWQVLKKMMKIAKDDLAPVLTLPPKRPEWYEHSHKLSVLIKNHKMAYRPLPKRQHALLMNVLAQCEYWYDLVMEHKRKLMNDPTASLDWKQNARKKYLAETKKYRPPPPPPQTRQPQTTTKRTSRFRRR